MSDMPFFSDRRLLLRSLYAVAPVLALCAVWQAGAFAAGSRMLPGPLAAARAVWHELETGALPLHLGVSLGRVAVGFAGAMIAGSALGLLLGLSGRLDYWLRPWLVVMLNLPMLVIIILVYIWFGLGEGALWVAVIAAETPLVAVTLREGAHALDRDYAEVAAIYRFGPWKTLRHVMLPQLAPYLLAASRNGLALVWKIVLVAELLGQSSGVGFQLHTYFQLFDIPRVLTYAMSFVICMLVIEAAIFTPLERSIAGWRR